MTVASQFNSENLLNSIEVSPDEVDKKELVEEIRNYPYIWDTKCRAYKNNNKRPNV